VLYSSSVKGKRIIPKVILRSTEVPLPTWAQKVWVLGDKVPSWISENGATFSVSVGQAATTHDFSGRSVVSLTLLGIIIAVDFSYMLFPRLREVLFYSS